MALPLRTPVAALALGLAAALGAVPGARAAGRGEETPLGLPGAPRAADPGPAASGGGIVRTVVGLAIVLAVIYGLTWVLRQLRAAREGQASGSGLQAIGSVPLGAAASLHLVRAGRDVVLLGVAEKGVVAIRTYAEEEARRVGLLEAGPEPALEPVAGVGVELVPRPLRRAPAAPPALAPVLASLRRATVRR